MKGRDKELSQLRGVAGVHYIASYLSFLGLHAVPTTRNVRGPDLLVSNLSGSKSLTLQVKTTISALRLRGRGKNKKPHHYEWDIGWSSARSNHRQLYFGLVDLKRFQGLPDVFILPSRVVHAYFKHGDPAVWRRARYHPPIDDVEKYKNNWNLVIEALSDEVASGAA